MTDTSAVERILPSSWSAVFGYDQAQLRPAPARLLTLAGQASIDADGVPRHDGDLAGQLTLAMDNVEQLLAAGGMTFGDVLSLTVYATDVDATLAHYAVIADRLRAADATPPATLVGVTRLAIPSLLVEIAATAGR